MISNNNKPNPIVKHIVLFAILVVFTYPGMVCVFLVVQWFYLAPPKQMKSLSELRSTLPSSRVHGVSMEGNEYFVVFGRWLLPNDYSSGYLFDANGRFIGWSPEAGDVDSLSEYWLKARFGSDNTSMSWGEAIERVRLKRDTSAGPE